MAVRHPHQPQNGSGRLFDLIAIVDWSAAASIGPARPSPDRCWIGGGSPRHRAEATYFRNRAAAMVFLRELLLQTSGSALVGWDFPHGFPRGSLGGGRGAATRLARLLEQRPP